MYISRVHSQQVSRAVLAPPPPDFIQRLQTPLLFCDCPIFFQCLSIIFFVESSCNMNRQIIFRVLSSIIHFNTIKVTISIIIFSNREFLEVYAQKKNTSLLKYFHLALKCGFTIRTQTYSPSYHILIVHIGFTLERLIIHTNSLCLVSHLAPLVIFKKTHSSLFFTYSIFYI